MLIKQLWQVFAATVIVAVFSAPGSAQPVVADLSAAKAAYGPTEAIELHLTLRNVGPSAVSILSWKLPFQGIEDDIFVVTRDGVRVPYTGPLFKRAAPRIADWVRIPAGGEVTGTFDLAGAYAVEDGGNVTVRFQLPLGLGYAKSRMALSGTVLSDAAIFILDPRPVADEFVPEDDVATQYLSPGFRSCSASRQTLIKTALASAQSYATGGYNHLAANPGGSSRYTRWFGRFSTARLKTAKDHFSRMKSAFITKKFTFDCSCNRAGVFAYVYKNRPYQVWLCPVFWRVRNTGQDSKAGTLVHETSHFSIIGNTNDYVYGASNARWLAYYYPSYAVFNADNHEYFVELK